MSLAQAAKQHYCINKSVIKTGRIDEECEALMREDYGCKYASSRDSRAGMSAKVGAWEWCLGNFGIDVHCWMQHPYCLSHLINNHAMFWLSFIDLKFQLVTTMPLPGYNNARQARVV
jgi:hypothetical protein